jgi:hypothetical protein
MSQQISEEEQKKAISAVLNIMKKKDLSGLLAAQRSNTLDEYLRPHMDAYIATKFPAVVLEPSAANVKSSKITLSPGLRSTSNDSGKSENKDVDEDVQPRDIETLLAPPSDIPKSTAAATVTPNFHQNGFSTRLSGASAPTNGTMNGSATHENGRNDPDDDDDDDYAPVPSFSMARGRRISQLAGTAMEAGCEVWAKLPDNEEWVKATVISIAGFDQVSKVRGRTSVKKLSRFVLSVHADNDPYSSAMGEEVELISPPVEGSLEEFEWVKLRNEEDDDPAAVEGVEDLIRLSYLHEPAILHMLQQRFQRNLIYTNTGPILIAVVSACCYIIVCLIQMQS